jgi:hypothetical protein
LYNNVFKVSYTISATGKHYYIDDKLIPAWQQAKLFVQDRLYTQVKALVNGVLLITPENSDGCSPSKSIDELYDIDTTGGLTENINTIQNNDGSPTYEIYNETISCSTSEAEGTFSVTYNAILKRYNLSLNPLENAVLHTYTKNTTVSDTNQQEVSITAQGTVQGLVRGGFIHLNTEYSLPQNGSFITTINSAETKYFNAWNYFIAKIGNKTDLYDSFKMGVLGIDQAELLIKNGSGRVTSTIIIWIRSLLFRRVGNL